MTEKTLFLQYRLDDAWSEKELESLSEDLSEVVGDKVKIVLVPDGIEFLDKEEIEQMVDELKEVLQ